MRTSTHEATQRREPQPFCRTCAPNTQGNYYLSIESVGEGVNPNVLYTAYGSAGPYKLTVSGTLPPAPATVACAAARVVALPQAGTCAAFALAESSIYNVTSPSGSSPVVTVVPPLPSPLSFAPGEPGAGCVKTLTQQAGWVPLKALYAMGAGSATRPHGEGPVRP